jgi:hypothetical protein
MFRKVCSDYFAGLPDCNTRSIAAELELERVPGRAREQQAQQLRRAVQRRQHSR